MTFEKMAGYLIVSAQNFTDRAIEIEKERNQLEAQLERAALNAIELEKERDRLKEDRDQLKKERDELVASTRLLRQKEKSVGDEVVRAITEHYISGTAGAVIRDNWESWLVRLRKDREDLAKRKNNVCEECSHTTHSDRCQVFVQHNETSETKFCLCDCSGPFSDD